MFSGSVLSTRKLLNEPDLSLEEFVEKISELPLAFQPGEAWRYSVSIDVLGRVLEILEEKKTRGYTARTNIRSTWK